MASPAGPDTIAGPAYQPGPSSSSSIARGDRGAPPPSHFRIYHASREATESSFRGWMNRLFPSGPCCDCSTCCLTLYCSPCQYGKTHWRLEQLREHKDASNESYKPKDVCNRSCWIYFAFSLFGISCVPVGFQRNRIRATYGIDGASWKDFLASFCCQCCVMLQSDREIRAREGEERFITNKSYYDNDDDSQEGLVTSQPMPLQEMSYATQPPYEHVAPSIQHMETMMATLPISPPAQKKKYNFTNSPTFQAPGKALSHRDSNISTASRFVTKSEPAHRKVSDFSLFDLALFPRRNADIKRDHAAAKETDQKATKQAPNRQDTNAGHNTSDVPVTDTSRSIQHHDLEDPATKPKSDENHASNEVLPSENAHKASGLNTSAPATTPGGDEKRNARSSSTGASQDMTSQESNAGESGTARSSSESTVKKWKPSSIRGASKRPAPKKSVMMSYVHDFSDCPINKSVLDYYEKQEWLAQHKLGECALDGTCNH